MEKRVCINLYAFKFNFNTVLLLTYLGPLKNRQSSSFQFREEKFKALAIQTQSVYIKYENSKHIFWLIELSILLLFKKKNLNSLPILGSCGVIRQSPKPR